MIKLIHETNGMLSIIETAKLLNVQVGLTNLSEMPITPQCFDRIYVYNRYDKLAMTITFKLLDGTLDGAVVYYDKTYAAFEYLRVQYQRKTYDHVLLNYDPNPYFPENEALAITQIVSMNKTNRVIGIENIIKDLVFMPRGINVKLTIKKNFSLSAAIDEVRTLLIDNFSFNNDNYDYTINSVMTFQTMRNIINGVSARLGISNIEFTGTDDVAGTEFEYKFLLDTGIYDSLKTIELANANISGVSAEFKLNVTATYEAMVV
jgi:hypothetical protein